MRPAALLLLAAPSLAQGKVHEVFGPDGAVAIQDAVTAATDGDVLLVHTGIELFGFAIDGKSLTVVAAPGADVDVRTMVAVRNLSAGQTVVLRGLHIHHDPAVGTTPGQIVLVENCAGAVRIEDCAVEGFSNPLYGAPAIYADGAASLVLARCTLTDEQNPFASIGHPSGAVVAAGGSHVTVLGGSLRGAEGAAGYCRGFGIADGAQGGPAALVQDGFLLLSGTSLEGGSGGAPDDPGPPACPCSTMPSGGHPGGGGPGLALSGAATACWNLDSSIQSGAPGTSPTGCPPGPTAPPIEVSGGAYQAFTGSAFSFQAATPVSELGTLTLDVAGPPAALVVLAYGPSAADLFFEPWKGSFLLPPSGASVHALGMLSPAGSLSAALTLGQLPPGWESTVLHAQVAGLDGGSVVLGFASSVVILDQAF